jgi:hypothetical protein
MPSRKEPWQYRLNISDIVAWNAEQCKADVKAREVLLMLDALVDRDEGVEVARYAT